MKYKTYKQLSLFFNVGISLVVGLISGLIMGNLTNSSTVAMGSFLIIYFLSLIATWTELIHRNIVKIGEMDV